MENCRKHKENSYCDKLHVMEQSPKEYYSIQSGNPVIKAPNVDNEEAWKCNCCGPTLFLFVHRCMLYGYLCVLLSLSSTNVMACVNHLMIIDENLRAKIPFIMKLNS